MAKFQTTLLALVGKGAQKRNVQRYSKEVKKSYRKHLEILEDRLEDIEDKIDDLTSHTTVNIKTGAGTSKDDANQYVMARAALLLEKIEVKDKIKAFKKAYIEDFTDEVDLGVEEVEIPTTPETEG